MLKLKDLNAQYITNSEGKKTAVILPIDEFQNLLDKIVQNIDEISLRVQDTDEDTMTLP